jgi:transcriptional regulator with XRE-family HTH domain
VETESEQRRLELAAFLRNRRGRRKPADVGLHVRGKRRTPGLRREELADLAGISATWYTWLEQAREIRASRRVLDRLACVLALDEAEKSHLFRLAGEVPPHATAAHGTTPYENLVAQLDPNPAFLTNRRLDIIMGNRGFELCYGDLSGLPDHERNLLWLTFTSPALRALSADWELDAAHIVAQFRSRLGDGLAEPEAVALVTRLKAASADFRRLWEPIEVAPCLPRLRVMNHPRLGRVELETLEMTAVGGGATLQAHLARPGGELQRRLADLVQFCDAVEFSDTLGEGAAQRHVAQHRAHQFAVVGRQEREVAAAEHHHPALAGRVLRPAVQMAGGGQRVVQAAEHRDGHLEPDVGEAPLRLGAQP